MASSWTWPREERDEEIKSERKRLPREMSKREENKRARAET